MQRAFDGGGAKFIGSPDRLAPFDSTAGHPHSEAVGIVIPTGAGLILGDRLSSEFATPYHQCTVEKPSAFQIFEQGCDGFIRSPRV